MSKKPKWRPKPHTKPGPERPDESKTRRCLNCQKEFRSTWAGNRLCGNCARRSE